MRLGAKIGAGWLSLLLFAWAASALRDYDVLTDVHPDLAGQGPAAGLWLGADHLGRDVLERLVTAVGASFRVGLVATLVSLAVSLPLGAIGGVARGLWAELCGAPMALLGSIPRFVLVLVISMIFGDPLEVLGVAAGLAWAPALSAELSGRLRALSQREFVEAALAHGLHPARVLVYHLLWVNGRRLIGRSLLQLFGFVLVLESTLSYIGGFGVPEPWPSWGNMLAFEFGVGDGNPLAWLAPALTLWATVLSTVLLADALGEAEHAV